MATSKSHFTVVIACLCAAGSVSAASYYVAPTGDDVNGNGTLTNPWRTPNRAKSAPKAGDTLYFRGGDYPLNDYLYLNGNSGTSAARITFTSYPGETARFVYGRTTLPRSTSEHQVVYIARPFVNFERIAIYQTPASRAFFMDRGLPENMAAATGLAGIQIFANDVVVRNCTIENVQGTGIKGHGLRSLVENNRIIGMWEHGFYLSGSDGHWRNNFIDGSRGYSNSQGITIQWNTTARNRLYGNLVINGKASGVVFSGAIVDNEVFNNVFINCGHKTDGGYGVVLNYWHQDGAIGSGNKFYNNTIMGKRPSSALIALIDGRLVDTYNNIFRPDATTPVGGAAGFRIHDNIFMNSTGIPSGNRSLDPKLVNPLGMDANSAKLLPGSLAIDTAVGTAPEVDFSGRRRTSAPDVGAHEFVPGSTVGPRVPTQLRVR